MGTGLVLGTALGFLFGLSVRTRGVYFILVTLAMGYVIWGVGYRWSALTGGDSGVTNVPPPQLAGLSFDSGMELYYVVLFTVLLVLFLYQRLVRSPFGLALRGIKAGEARMRSLGFSPAHHLYAPTFPQSSSSVDLVTLGINPKPVCTFVTSQRIGALKACSSEQL